jgi:hypothetical protein
MADYIPDETNPPNTFNMSPPQINAVDVTFSWELNGDDPTDPSSGMKGYRVFIEKGGSPFITYPDDGQFISSLEASATFDIQDGDGYSAYIMAYDKAGNSTRSNPGPHEQIGTINFDLPSITVNVIDTNGNEVQIEQGQTQVIPSDPAFTILADDGNGVTSIDILVKRGNDVIASDSDAPGTTVVNFPPTLGTLPEGEYTLSVTADDGTNSDTLTATIIVSSGVKILDIPWNAPNPFMPGVSDLKIKYTLASPTDVKIVIYSLSGKPVRTINCGAIIDEGGKGGLNEVSWDTVNGKVIGRGEMAAYK